MDLLETGKMSKRVFLRHAPGQVHGLHYNLRPLTRTGAAAGKGSRPQGTSSLQCSFYREARGTMMAQLQAIQGLRRRLSDYDALVSDLQAISYIAEFMHQTGLLGEFSPCRASCEVQE